MKLNFNTARHFAALALLLSVNVAAQSAPPITDLSTALTTAKVNGKPIFVYVFDSV